MSQEGLPLPALQKWMHGALVQPAAAGTGVEHLDNTGRLSARDGLAIYQRSYFQRIAACMREQFPALCYSLGQTLFDDFVADYILKYPPSSYTLYNLGKKFPDYLNETRPDKDQPSDQQEVWTSFMIDLANFELTLFGLFDSVGSEGKCFATAETADDRLQLQACFALGDYQFPVATYYHEIKAGRSPELPPVQSSQVAICRVDYRTRTVPLTAAQYQFLDAMRCSGSIDGAITLLAKKTGFPKTQVLQQWHEKKGARARWIKQGFFIQKQP